MLGFIRPYPPNLTRVDTIANESGPVLAAVGDLMLGDSATTVGWGFMSRYAPGDDASGWSRMASTFEAYDIVFGNLETVLASESRHTTRWRADQMRGSPSFALALAHAGFDVLSLANNHAMQHGPEAFRETVRVLEEVGIRACGLRGEDPWTSEPVELECHGIRIGFLGYSLRPRQYSDAPLYAEGERDEILADVRRLAQAVDHVVVSLHWGEEFVADPSEEEVSLAADLIRAGCRVLVGHHPHVLRPVERVDGGVVAYSLGNFVSNMTWQEGLRRSAVLVTRLGSHGADFVDLLPFRIGEDFFPRSCGGCHTDHLVRKDLGVGLPSEAYMEEAQRELASHRIALYGNALKNLWRYPPEVLREFAVAVLGNKLRAVKRILSTDHSS